MKTPSRLDLKLSGLFLVLGLTVPACQSGSSHVSDEISVIQAALSGEALGTPINLASTAAACNTGTPPSSVGAIWSNLAGFSDQRLLPPTAGSTGTVPQLQIIDRGVAQHLDHLQ
jgi:hypothetical protein